MTIVEVTVAVAILAAFGVGAIEALLSLNRGAASTRVMTAAREVVERNMEAAMTVPFTAASVPPVLALTSGTGWDENSDVALGSVNIPLVVARDGTALVSGTLKRTVELTSTATFHPDTRRITFALSYSVNGRSKPDYSLTSIRSPDE